MQPWIWKSVRATALAQDAKLQADWDRLNAERGGLPFLSSGAVNLSLQIFGAGGERLLPLCLSLPMTQVDPLLTPRENDSPQSRHDDYIEAAWVDISGTFDDYRAARGKNLHKNMRKQRNKLLAEGTAVEMRVWRKTADMTAAIARYGSLEEKSWKAQEGTAIRPDNKQGRFYSALFENAAAQGETVVYEYLFDGKTVASNLCLQWGGTLVILKTTYDESIKTYSPAFMLNEELIQALFSERQITRLEYYGRVMEWQTRWTENRRTICPLTTFRNSLIKTIVSAMARWRKSSIAAPHDATPEAV
jgi:CelD/BcsL family acetyltransferase involved in cellulose biosynthesis